MKILEIGSRIEHPEYGKGVITNVSSTDYWVTFIEKGLETIPLDDTFNIIEAVENEVDTVSFRSRNHIKKPFKKMVGCFRNCSNRRQMERWKINSGTRTARFSFKRNPN